MHTVTVDRQPLVLLTTRDFAIRGMTCIGCANTIREALMRRSGVKQVSVSISSDSAKVSFDRGKVSAKDIISAVDGIGFKASEMKGLGMNSETLDAGALRKTVFCVTIAVFQITICMFFMDTKWYTRRVYGAVPAGALIELFLSSAALVTCGRHIIVKALMSIASNSPGMEFLIFIGISISFSFSVLSMAVSLMAFSDDCSVFFETTTTLIATYFLGKMLEMKAKMRCSEHLCKLETVFPKYANRVVGLSNDEKWEAEQVPINTLKQGDRVKVLVDERVPVDGICSRECLMDESIITGESLPVEKKKGEQVFAGSLALSETIISASSAPDNTLVHQIASSMREGQEEKPKIQAVADILAGRFVAIIVVLGIVTFITWTTIGTLGVAPKQFYALGNSVVFAALKMATTVITIACPCALGLAAPMAIAVGKGSAAKKGIIIMSSHVIDTAEQINCIAFDKTGTLTVGKPEVVDCLLTSEQYAAAFVMSTCAELEQGSSHILGKAIFNYCRQRAKENVCVAKIKHTNDGVDGYLENGDHVFVGRAQLKEQSCENEQLLGRTIVQFTINNQLAAKFVIGDKLRTDAGELVAKFRASGYKVCIVSGDQLATTKAVADAVKITEFYAPKSPFEKAELMAVKQECGECVCFVGDGINDAPALGRANLSMAVGAATDLTTASADIVLLKPSLRNVYDAIDICRMIRRKIVVNFGCAAAYNLVAIPIAAGALLPYSIYISPTYSGAFMAMSSLTVLVSSILLK